MTAEKLADPALPARTARSRVSASALAWLAVAVAWLYVFPYHRALNNPNEVVRVYQTIAIVQHHTLAIDKVLERFGWVNDMAMREVPVADGTTVLHHYAGKAPGTSLAGVVPYFVARSGYLAFAHREPTKAEAIYWLRLLTVVLPSIAFLWFMRRHLLARVGETLTAQALVAWGLGTMATPYTEMFASHQLTAIAAFGAFLLARTAALRDEAGVPWLRVALPLAAAGALVSLAVMSEYPLAIGALCLFVYVLATLRNRLQVLAFIAGGLPGAAMLGAFHKIAFGKVMTTAYAHLANPAFAEGHSHGFFGLVKPSVESVRGTLFAPDYGLFVFSPLLLVGLAAALVVVVKRQRAQPEPLLRADAWLTVALFASMVLFNASMNIWRAGWCVGPRYIAVLTPFLALWAALGLRRWSQHAAPARGDLLIALAGGLGIVGMLLSGVSGLSYPHYPTEYVNPVFQLLLPVLRAGYLPHHAGELVGLRGWAGVLPLLAVLVGAVVLVAGTTRGRPWRLPLALAVAATLLVPYSRINQPAEQVKAGQKFVRDYWEPQPIQQPKPVLEPQPVRKGD